MIDMIEARNIFKSYGPLNVLSGVSFSLEAGQKAALVGYNGTGKSTLLKILAGEETIDAGKLEIAKTARIGYLPQDMGLAGNETVVRYLKRVSDIGWLEEEIARGGKSSEAAQAAYEVRNGYAFSHRMETMLAGFGFADIDVTRSLSSLSSGQKSKVALAGILLADVDVLLLDEPTNNLDLPALIWLEDFLQTSKAAAIIVSHDRRFLDNVASKIFELDWQTRALTVTNGNYSDYLVQCAKRRARQKEAYEIQQEEIGRLHERIRALKERAEKGSRWIGSDNDKVLRDFKRDRAARSARGAKAIETRIGQMDKIEKPAERKPFDIPLAPDGNRRNCDIAIRNLVAGYPGGFTLGPVSLDIKFGTRVGILGLNGSGKSTLLKTIAGHLPPIEGEVAIGKGVTLGDMMQEHDSLPRDVMLLEYIKQRANVDEEHAYGVLGGFGFAETQARAFIGALSPGGRARLLLALFSVFSTNTLLLDEPTNHLDLEAMEALEEALASYRGTVIAVSHDRTFMEKLSPDDLLLIEQGTVKRIKDYQTYVAAIEKNAKRMIRLLR